jgi:hypothetical protein
LKYLLAYANLLGNSPNTRVPVQVETEAEKAERRSKKKEKKDARRAKQGSQDPSQIS